MLFHPKEHPLGPCRGALRQPPRFPMILVIEALILSFSSDDDRSLVRLYRVHDRAGAPEGLPPVRIARQAASCRPALDPATGLAGLASVRQGRPSYHGRDAVRRG